MTLVAIRSDQRCGMHRNGFRIDHAHVVNELGKEIIGGTFVVGQNLPNDAVLEKRFGVSRTVLSETVKTLAAKGLLVARARTGTKDSNPNQSVQSHASINLVRKLTTRAHGRNRRW